MTRHFRQGVYFQPGQVKRHYRNRTSITPTQSAASGAFTTTSATGHWSREGDKVFISCQAVITDVGTGSGDWTIALPSTVPAASSLVLHAQPLHVDPLNVTLATDKILVGSIAAGTRNITVKQPASNSTSAVLDAENGTLTIHGWYFTDDNSVEDTQT